MIPLRAALKSSLTHVTGRVSHARYDRCILIVSHMRAATTALSNVLTAHPQITGFGETQVSHADERGPARLLLSYMAQGILPAKSTFLFDKILHNAHDTAPDSTFFGARCIFMLRPPAPTIASIMKLAACTDMARYRQPDAAARYYIERVTHMSALWDGFAPHRRIGILSDTLWQNPEATLRKLSTRLGLEPVLQNTFRQMAVPHRFGQGDPFADTSVTQIEKRAKQGSLSVLLDPKLSAKCEAAFLHLKTEIQRSL